MTERREPATEAEARRWWRGYDRPLTSWEWDNVERNIAQATDARVAALVRQWFEREAYELLDTVTAHQMRETLEALLADLPAAAAKPAAHVMVGGKGFATGGNVDDRAQTGDGSGTAAGRRIGSYS